MQCPECSGPNPEQMKFCGHCGARLSRACPSCSAANLPEDVTCMVCGAAISLPQQAGEAAEQSILVPPTRADMAIIRRHLSPQLSAKISASQSGIEGQRRQITVLCADMKGYTPLAESLGEEGIYQLVERVYECLIAAVHRHEGTVQELTGDGILALFGAPIALEDAPLRACQAALAIQARMRALGAEIEAERGVRPKIRIGIHTGPVIVGTVGTDLRTEYKAVGDTVNLAARLESMAEPGSTLISESTYRLVDGYVASAFAGERAVKGKSAPQRLYRLDGLNPGILRFDISLQRGLSPFVGRSRDLETLERCWRQTSSGTIQVVHVVGEAGIGKSRLLHELQRRLDDARTVILHGHCTASGGSTSFLPFIGLTRTIFHLSDSDDPDEVTRKVRQGLETLEMPTEGCLVLLLALFGLEVDTDALRGLDAEIIGARTRDVLEEVLTQLGRRSQVVVVIEDLHWIDTASEALLQRIADSDERIPLLLLCSQRPPYRPAWAGGPRTTEVHLEPLSEDDTLALIEQRLQIDAAPHELTEIIVTKAEGNPLFAEEIMRYLLESGHLQRTNGHVSWSGTAATLQIPATLQDLLLARFDRLEDSERTVLQVASVIGRRFPVSLIHTVSGLNGTLPRCLRDLEAQEIIFRHDVEDRETYQFTHALIQDVIYNTLLTPRRMELHERVAEAIEGTYAAQLGEWVEVLAHHWGQTKRLDRAMRYFALAGERSLRVYALEEAHRYFARVVDLIDAAPKLTDHALLADVLLGWVKVHYYRKDFNGLIALGNRYLSRVEAMGDTRRHALLLFWLGFSHAYGLQARIATGLLEKALAMAEAIADEECIGYASLGLMNVYSMTPGGRPHDVVDRLGERALEIAGRLKDVYLASYCLLWLALQKFVTGRLADARDLGWRLQELGRAAGDQRAVGMGLYIWALVNVNEERFVEALENAEESLRISPDPLARLAARAAKGMALALHGQAREGADLLREAREECIAGNFLTPLLGIDLPYGAALVLAGNMTAGVRWLEASISRFSELGNETQVATGHMILGEIYLQILLGKRKPPLRVLLRNVGFVVRTVPIAARKCRYHLQEAVRRARELTMPGVLARSLLSLALLCQAKTQVEEAREYLEEAATIAQSVASSFLSEKIRAALTSLD